MSKKILVRGPALSRSGYGEHCRTVLRALRSEDENDIYLLNVGWGVSGWLCEDNEERQWIDSLIVKTAKAIQSGERDFDTSIQVQLPSEWQPLCKNNIGVTAGVETTKAPDDWSVACNNVSRVIVPSEHSRKCFSEEVRNKIDVVNFPARNHKEEKTNFEKDINTEFNFLTVAQWNPRKNLEQTIAAFLSEFQNENVGLIVKTGISGGSKIDRQETLNRIQGLLSLAEENRKCKIYLLHGSLSDAEMSSLYKNKKVSAYVTTSHGEGFGLPVFEAAQSALPVIAANWGGLKEFSNNMFVEVDYKEEELQEHHIWNGVLEEGTSWCYPDMGSFRKSMREVYTNYSEYKKKARKLRKHIVDNFTEQEIYIRYNNIINEVIGSEQSTEGENNETE
jgi:glycosyltransferase involved in cell wall biosynthesis